MDWGSIWQQWPVAARCSIVVATCNAMMQGLLCILLERKRKVYVCIAVGLSSVVVKALFNNFLGEVCANSLAVRCIYAVVVIMQIFLMFFELSYVFRGSMVKSMVVAILSEAMACLIGTVALIFVNLIEGRPVDSDLAPIHGADFLIPVFSAAIFFVLYQVLKRWRLWLRRLQLKREKLWVLFCLCYYSSGIALVLLQTRYDYQIVYYISSACMISAVVIYLWIFVDAYQKQQQAEHAYLQRQRRIFSLHYEAVGRQIMAMEQAREKIDTLMETLYRTEGKQPLRSERLQKYLSELKEQSEKLQGGMYCSDWIVDSLLYQQEELCRKKGITVDICMQGFDRRDIRDEDISDLLFYLFQEAVAAEEAAFRRAHEGPAASQTFEKAGCGAEPAGTISLHAGRVANQLVIRMVCSKGAKRQFSGRAMRGILQTYHGSLRRSSADRQAAGYDIGFATSGRQKKPHRRRSGYGTEKEKRRMQVEVILQLGA